MQRDIFGKLFSGTRSVRSGQQPQSWNIPLSNPRSINLQARCVASKVGKAGSYYCPRLSFADLSLE